MNVIKENGYSIVEMNRRPVNSLSLELSTELVNVIDNLEADPACQGMILTSVSIMFKLNFGHSLTYNIKTSPYNNPSLKNFW